MSVYINQIYRRIHTDSKYRVLEATGDSVSIQSMKDPNVIITYSRSYFIDNYELVDSLKSARERG